jgi:hypothetical protein
MLTLLVLLILLVVAALWRSGVLGDDDEGSTLDVLKGAVGRDAGGGLILRQTPELTNLRSEISDLWFIIRDKEGHRLSEGTVPSDFMLIADALDHISDARLGRTVGGASPPAGLVKWVDTPAGKVQILTGTQGSISVNRVIAAAPPLFLNIILPIIGLMALATLFATPFVVRRAMAGLGQAAAQAERIDIDRRGVQLSVEEVPMEVIPLVKAVNDALGPLAPLSPALQPRSKSDRERLCQAESAAAHGRRAHRPRLMECNRALPRPLHAARMRQLLRCRWIRTNLIGSRSNGPKRTLAAVG